MTEDEIVTTFGILLLAGTETTATLLSFTTYHLLSNPTILRKLKEEIRSAFKNEGDITMVSVNKLQYLLAVLQEAMRIHPPTPIGTIRATPEGGSVICGKWVPGDVSSLPL